MPARSVVLVVFDGFQLLDLAGPADVFAAATRLAAPDPGYRLRTAALAAGTVRAGNGTGVVADAALGRVRGRIDTLLVAGGWAMRGDPLDPDLVEGVRRLARP